MRKSNSTMSVENETELNTPLSPPSSEQSNLNEKSVDNNNNNKNNDNNSSLIDLDENRSLPDLDNDLNKLNFIYFFILFELKF
jgi:hypothetical protein